MKSRARLVAMVAAALRKGGKTTGYYNMTAASYGQQAGVQSFS